MPFTQAGNAFTRDLLYDRYTNKQFIAIETRGGDVFYMVIDYDKPLDEDGEQYETYFLNLVDSRDLLDIVDESLIEPEIVYVTPEPTVPGYAAAGFRAGAKGRGSSAPAGAGRAAGRRGRRCAGVCQAEKVRQEPQTGI